MVIRGTSVFLGSLFVPPVRHLSVEFVYSYILKKKTIHFFFLPFLHTQHTLRINGEICREMGAEVCSSLIFSFPRTRRRDTRVNVYAFKLVRIAHGLFHGPHGTPEEDTRS